MNGIKSTVEEVSRATSMRGKDWGRLERAVGTLQSSWLLPSSRHPRWSWGRWLSS